MTPLLSVRYVGGSLDGYSESGSERRPSRDQRSRRARRTGIQHAQAGFVRRHGQIDDRHRRDRTRAAERLGNQTIDTVLLGQNLSFVTPGQASAVGGVVDAGIQYHPVGSISLFICAEGTAMSDRSYSGAATGGARVSF
jgi:hypothetical protein